MSKKILIIEDQEGIRMLLKEVFTSEEYDVAEASDGKLAMDMIETLNPDVILLDMKLPRFNGIDILRFCNAHLAHAKIIMMTAYGELEFIDDAHSLGAVTFFSKPFDILELKRYVDGLFSDVISENV
jgi:two-component system response regulator (stage 0 sporulation protein F)